MIRSSLRFGGSKRTGSGCLTPNRLSAAILLALSGPVYALPQGGVVAAGDATIEVSGDTMQVLQSSQRAILNFQSFDIGSGQTVNFQQPGSDAVALNRVLGDRLSEIHGALNANGQVYLINPNGVVFGNGAELNVGGLVVTTLDIADQDFLAGRGAFSGGAEGRIENRGSITAQDRVVLLAPEVVNSGDIQVPDGDILLRSSRQALLHTAGSEIPILVDDPGLVGRVTNEGTLRAGEVALVLDGSGRGDVYDSAINNSGLVRAARASGEGGEIRLLAATGVVNSGSLDASAVQGDGGTISIVADSINQSGSITTTATGAGDGGDIELLASHSIAMHSGSTIDASADQNGDAGDVVVIAEKATWFTDEASINARGGDAGGDGGFVEVSGREFISINGAVDAGASNGEAGLWYIDPTDITITNAFDSNSDFTNSNPSNWFPNSAANTALINVTTLRNALVNNTNVRIDTASAAGGLGNITVDTVLDINNLGATRSLTLVADNEIIFTANGGIWDSAPGTVDGLNFTATAAAGFRMVDGTATSGTGVLNAGAGKIDITVQTGNAVITGLASSSAAADAIRVRTLAGGITSGGNRLWDVMTLNFTGGVVLQARDDIDQLALHVNVLEASSSNGNVGLYVGAEDVGNPGAVVVNRLTAAGTAGVHTPRTLSVTNASVLSGTAIQLSSELLVSLPQEGLITPGALTLLAPDIVAANNSDPGNPGRTLTLGATALTVNTNAAGGNLLINSTVDSISVTNGFSNTITVVDANAITLGAIDPLAGAISISSGVGSDLTVGTNLDLSNKAGSLTLGAGRNLLVNASILDTDGSGITLTAPQNVTFGTNGAINAGAGAINITATGGSVALGALTGGAITVAAGGSITDANGATANLSGTSAVLTAGTFIGTLSDRLETSLGSLSLNTGNGGAFIQSGQALTLTQAAVAGNLNIGVTAGNLTLAQSAPAVTGSATFLLDNGNLVIPVAGLDLNGRDLTIAANTIVDSNNAVSLVAQDADITLRNAIGNLTSTFDTLVLNISGGLGYAMQNTSALVLRELSSNQDVAVSASTLEVQDIVLGGNNITLNFEATTTLTQTGSLTSSAGADNVALEFISGTGMSINGNLRDANSAAGAHYFDFTAGTNFTMASNAQVAAWGGGIVIEALNGNVAFTGLSSTSSATNAIQLSANLGAISSANAALRDIDVANGGFVAHAQDSITDLMVESSYFDAISTAGDVSLQEATSTSALRLQAFGTADISAQNDLSLAEATVFSVENLVVDVGDDFVIADTGLVVSGDLTSAADNLRDSNANVSLQAVNANITLNGAGTQNRTWTTAFDQLVLDIAGTGDLTLNDTNALALTSISTAGNVAITTSDGNLTVGAATLGGSGIFTATDGDVTLVAAPAVTGNLSLITVGSGNVVLPNTGLTVSGNLTVNADELHDSDADLTMAAANASITLRNVGNQARIWSTSFDQLVLSLAGTGDITLTDTDALTLASVATGGNASFTTSDGNLTFVAGTIGGNAAFTATDGDISLTNSPTITGNLSLTTVNTGDVILPNAGLTVGGNLTVAADDLRDSDADLSLAAANANITLRDAAAQARTWNTSFDQLILSLAGNGAFSLTDTDALTLTSVTTGGNASFTTSDGNLTLVAGSIGGNAAFTATDGDVALTNDPTITGNLSLITVGSGDVILPNAGLTVGGNLTVDADDLRDSDADLILAAANANITLRDTAAQARTWSTSFDQLILSLAGPGAFSLTDTDALTLTSVTTGGNASFTTSDGNLTLVAGSIGGNAAFTATDGDLTLTNSPTITGDLSLITVNSGDVMLPNAGLTVGGSLTIDADDLSDSDANLTLAATNATITLRNADTLARTWSTSFDQLFLSLAGTGAFSLTDADTLTLTSVTTGGNASFTTSDGNLTLVAGTIGGNAAFTATDGDVTLTTAPTITGNLSLATVGSGDVVLPNAGLTVGGNLTVAADDLRDSDANLTLAATNATITLRNADTQTRTWNTNFDQLALSLAGTGDFSLTNADALTLTSAAAGGNASFTATDGDLTVGTSAIAGNASFTAANGGITFGAGTIGGNASFTATGSDVVLTAAPTITGDLSLTTIGSGNVLLPAAGISIGGNLTVDADDLRDGDANLTLAAANANITLRDASAQARTWSTSFDQLVLSLTGPGAFSLIDADALTLTSVTAGGNASFATSTGNLTLVAGTIGGNAAFTATDGDVTLTNAPTISGDLSLITVGSGDVILPNAGLSVGGNLTVDADDLRDSDANLTLAATNATITLRDAGIQARTWTTTFDQLVLSLAGTGDFTLTNADSLLASVTTGGNASISTLNGVLTLNGGSIGGDAAFSATDGDLVLTDAPSVTGDLSLTTVGSGDVILPNAGLTVGGDLTVDADDLRDSDANLTLAATNATITLRDAGTQARTWTTTFDQLVLDVAGTGDFALNNSTALNLTSVTTGGNTSVATLAGDLTVGTGSISGNANFTAANGLAVTSLNAGGDANLTASNGGLTFGAGTIGGDGTFTATDGDVTLTNAPTVTGDLSLTTVGSGDVILPNAGLSVGGNLAVDADDLRDSDANLTLAATNATITLRDAGTQARTWTTSFDQLVLDVAGTGDLALNNSTALGLSSITTGGNTSVATLAGDLTVGTGAIGGNANFTAANGLAVTSLNTGGDANLTASNGGLTFGAGSVDGNARFTAANGLTVTSLNAGGDADLTASNGDLTFGAGTIGGDGTFTATDGDVTLTNAPTVTGDLSLTTIGSGDVILPNAGLTIGGDLTVDADDLRDSDANLTLAATNATITLRDAGTLARTWTTTFDQLVLDVAGTGDFALNNSTALGLTSITTGGNTSVATLAGDLTVGTGAIGGNASFTAASGLAVTSLNAGGDADLTASNGGITFGAGTIGGDGIFTATDGDVTLTNAPTVTGDLSLTTVGSGDVILPNAGLSVGGNLAVDADDLRDSDANLTLAATNATITLRDAGTQARTWTTSFDQLVLDVAGMGDLTLNNSTALNLTSVTTGGNTSVATLVGDLTVGTGSIGGNANFTAANGLAVTSLNAGGDANLTASNGGLAFGAGTIGGDGTFTATDGDVTLTNAPTVTGDLSLTTIGSGDVVLPNAGLTVGGDLTVDANDLRDSDADLTLAATNATITLRNVDTQARTWNTSFDQLVLSLAGTGDFNLTNTDSLLASVTTGGNASISTDNGALTLNGGSIGGDAAFSATDGDITLINAPSVTGDLSLTTVGSGDVILPNAGLTVGGNLMVDADDLRDSDSNLTLAATNANITLRDAGAQARTWNTSFDQLVLSIAGTGDFNLTDTDALTLTAVTTGGDASFSATNADLVLVAAPVVAGELSLSTLGNGDLILPEAGLLHSGDLRLEADDLVGAAGVILGAADADITLRGGALAQSWATRFDSLALTIAGAGDFALTDSNGLTLTAVNTGGNASFSTTNADLVLATGTVTAGALALETVDSGDVVIADAGLAYNGALTVTADRLRDSNADIILSATDLTASLREHDQAAVWDTTLQRLDLATVGGGALRLNNTGALIIDGLNSDGAVVASTTGNLQLGTLVGAGDMAFSSGDDLILLNSVYNVGGRLSLTATDELRLASAGLSADNMTLTAARLTAAGGAALMLAGNAADLTLTGNQALALSTRLSQLGLTYNGGSLSLNNDRNLALTRFSVPNAANVGLSVSGTLTLPASGLHASQRLTVDAVDMQDGDRNMSFSAAELAVRLSGASGNHVWNVDTDSLDVLMRGQANLHVNANNGLVLEDLNNDAQAVSLENGNFSLNLASGDLTLAGAVSAADLTADGVRAGVIDLEVAQGSVLTRGVASLTSTNLVDQAGSGDGIRIRLTDPSAAGRSITLGDTDSSAVTLRAVGGDILLDSRAAIAPSLARRQVIQNTGTIIDAYNSPGDSLTGRILINGEVALAQPGQLVRAGRTLAIVTDMAPQVPGNVLDELDDLDGSTDIIRDPDKSGPKAAAQFEQVFGICDELDRKNRHRCRVDDALKSFLSHWLVGGEMPPKSEMR